MDAFRISAPCHALPVRESHSSSLGVHAQWGLVSAALPASPCLGALAGNLKGQLAPVRVCVEAAGISPVLETTEGNPPAPTRGLSGLPHWWPPQVSLVESTRRASCAPCVASSGGRRSAIRRLTWALSSSATLSVARLTARASCSRRCGPQPLNTAAPVKGVQT